MKEWAVKVKETLSPKKEKEHFEHGDNFWQVHGKTNHKKLN